MKSKLSSSLQNTSTAGTSTGLSADTPFKKIKLDKSKHVQTLSKAKTELTNVLTANVKEKISYEIDLLKATLEKEKLKIELLKLLKKKDHKRKKQMR